MYLSGFGNHHQSEAIEGALPLQQNSPLHCPLNLYAEQLSGSAFTKPRASNLHSWLYRKIPSVAHEDFSLWTHDKSLETEYLQPPNPFRWFPFEPPLDPINFIESWFAIAQTHYAATYLYHCNRSMQAEYFSNNDGELLIIPYSGAIELFTEFGTLTIAPGTIVVIPRGVRFKVSVLDSIACGYICENRGTPFSLPNLGLLGANALANPRHFRYPSAAFEKKTTKKCLLICKSQQRWWQAKSDYSPLNVIAWHGNYAPYSYDLSLFNTMNTVSFDHPDPSIFTVLSSESDTPGVANLDFVIFPSRWIVAEHSFRPPYFHRNIMSELMGLIHGVYEAKNEGFSAGGISIHNTMTAHGPDVSTYNRAIASNRQQPSYVANTLAFMLESRDPWLISQTALQHPKRDTRYSRCWQNFTEADCS